MSMGDNCAELLIIQFFYEGKLQQGFSLALSVFVIVICTFTDGLSITINCPQKIPKMLLNKRSRDVGNARVVNALF